MRVLIVDDDRDLRQSLSALLHEAGYDVEAEGDSEQALRRAVVESFDVILCDIRLPRMDGLTFLRRYHAEQGAASLIMMSVAGDEDAAIATMREGAYGHLRKPFRPAEVTLTLRKVEERDRLQREVEILRSVTGAGNAPETMVAESRVMRELLELMSRVARHDMPVLITGESGTGKEVLAHAMHCMGSRRDRRFTAVNCAAVPEHLLESELFGHVKGACAGAVNDRIGLFETVHEGTLLLHEIAELPLSLQEKLLHVLEDGEVRRVGAHTNRKVDVRVLAATAKPLEPAVERGEFRSDLYHRLNVVRLHLPPLRERPEDIPILIAYFARQVASRVGHPVSITPHALALLTDYPWPGNVRELRNAVERAVVLCGQGPLDVAAFALGGVVARTNGHHPGVTNGSFTLKTQVEEVERVAIQRALDAANGNRREAAHLLGVSLRTLFYKLRRTRLD